MNDSFLGFTNFSLLCFVLLVISCILPGLNMPVNHDCVINKFDVHFDGHDGVKFENQSVDFHL